MLRLYILTLCTSIISAFLFFSQTNKESTVVVGKGLVVPIELLQNTKNQITPKQDVRSPDQTYLTYPEWFLVFSPEEQANYFVDKTSTSFPYKSHIEQFWSSYKIVNDQIKDYFPQNTGYHFMIWVIGVSTTIEYSLKEWYETVVGRLTDTPSSVTDEDKFVSAYTRDYVDFIKIRPWYEYPYTNKLTDFCFSSTFFGDSFLRKLERKYIVISELLMKMMYSKLIMLGTQVIYEEASTKTAIVLNDGSIEYLPRYDKFKDAVLEVAESGKTIQEVAGNSCGILITVHLKNNDSVKSTNVFTLFTQNINSNKSMKRVALVVPVQSLTDVLLQLKKDKLHIEHVFDF